MIDQIQISNFRGITKLELGGLKRVNLIVGANNAGKTSLLEAVAILMMDDRVQDLAGLFRIKAYRSDTEFTRWLLNRGKPEGSVRSSVGSRVIFGKEVINGGKYQFENQNQIGDLQFGWEKLAASEKAHAISVHHLTPEAMLPAFADAVRSPKNEKLLESILAKVDSRVRSVRLDLADNQQLISIDLGLPERIPISQAGQGLYRMIAIFTELLGARPKICLIDEIENGIHWTALPVVWQGIAEIAEALDIQVFATTHSRECLTAAYEVFRKKGEGEAMDFSVIQLMRVKDEIQGRVLNGAHVEAAIENDIELR